MKYHKKRLNKNEECDLKWIFTVLILTFVMSIFFSYISTTSIEKLNIIPAIFLLLFVILVGIFFDIIGVAVTIAKENNFHAKAAKKITGAKSAIKLIRSSAKVSNFCADVIGDIAGVISGALSAIISLKLTSTFGFSDNLQFIISAFVASLTVSGKAFGKVIARKYSYEIVDILSKLFNIFSKKSKAKK